MIIPWTVLDRRYNVANRRDACTLGALFEVKKEIAVKKTTDVGKAEDYLTDNDVNDSIPDDVHSSQDTEDLLATLRTWVWSAKKPFIQFFGTM